MAVLAASLTFGIAHAGPATLNTGGSELAASTYIGEYEAFTQSDPSILFSYSDPGSAAGQTAFLNNDIALFENPPPIYGKIVGNQVDDGTSVVPLVANQLTNPATGSYANSPEDGPLIQVPNFGTPITLPYNESAETATLTLTDAQLCGVLSGKINDWHKLVSSIPAGTTIQVGYRADPTGTTYLIAAHLNPLCNSGNSNFLIPLPLTTKFTALFVNGQPPAHFTGENGSGALAAYLLATPNSFGYLPPEYTSVAPLSGNATSLKVSALLNGINKVAYTPTVANTELGLVSPGPGAVNTKPPANLAAQADPLNWVPANPEPAKGYSIVGYTTIDLSTCYFDQTAGGGLIKFLTDTYEDAIYKTLVENNGYAPLTNTNGYLNAVVDTFLSNRNNYNLNIDNETVCASYIGR
jgi:ABC-type phosphate transport system substrate-binding protein